MARASGSGAWCCRKAAAPALSPGVRCASAAGARKGARALLCELNQIDEVDGVDRWIAGSMASHVRNIAMYAVYCTHRQSACPGATVRYSTRHLALQSWRRNWRRRHRRRQRVVGGIVIVSVGAARRASLLLTPLQVTPMHMRWHMGGVACHPELPPKCWHLHLLLGTSYVYRLALGSR